MHEIDLIPATYRRARARTRLGWIFAGSAGAMLAVTAALWVGLAGATDRLTVDIAELQRQQAISAAERDELQGLTVRKGEFQQQLRMLAGLRSGAAAADLFQIVDEVLVEDQLWFLNWRFRRAGFKSVDTEVAAAPAYFVVQSAESEVGPNDWRVETHMHINGQAQDHAALSEFVKRLFLRPEIHDVRVKRTELRRYSSQTVVDFDMTVVVDSEVTG